LIYVILGKNLKEGYSQNKSIPKKNTCRADSAVAVPLAYFSTGEIAKLREKVRHRAFLVRERFKLRVKAKSVLTYEGLKWPSEHG
jgi:hypothetical protein